MTRLFPLLSAWSRRVPGRVRQKGWPSPWGLLFFPLWYAWVHMADVSARHCPFTVLRESIYRLMGVHIGRGTFVDRDVYFDLTWPELISIGCGCSIAQCSIILCHQYQFQQDEDRLRLHDRHQLIEGVQLADDVLIGSGAMLLPGVTIGTGAVVAAGAVVHKDVPPHCVAAGNPARVCRRLVQVEPPKATGDRHNSTELPGVAAE